MTTTHNTLVILCSSDSCVIGCVLLSIFVHATSIVYTRLFSDDNDDVDVDDYDDDNDNNDEEDDKDDNKYDAHVNTFGLVQLLAQRILMLKVK